MYGIICVSELAKHENPEIVFFRIALRWGKSAFAKKWVSLIVKNGKKLWVDNEKNWKDLLQI